MTIMVLMMMTLVAYVSQHGGQAMPYMVTLIIIEALINWLARGQRSVTAYTCLYINNQYIQYLQEYSIISFKLVLFVINIQQYLQEYSIISFKLVFFVINIQHKNIQFYKSQSY